MMIGLESPPHLVRGTVLAFFSKMTVPYSEILFEPRCFVFRPELIAAKDVTKKGLGGKYSVEFYPRVTCFFGDFRFAKKLKFLSPRAGFILFPRLAGALLRYARVVVGRNDEG